MTEEAIARVEGTIERATNLGSTCAVLFVSDLRALISLARQGLAMREIVDLADELINGGGLVNRGVDRGLVVVEKADRSDPHYRLCLALEARAALQQGAGR